MIYIILLIISGALLAVMTSLNGGLSNYYSLFGVSFFVHVIAVVLLVIYIKLFEKKKITFKGLPVYVYLVGFFGVSMTAIGSLCVLKIGATALTSLMIVGQMIAAVLVDHFAWFKVPKKKFSLKQLPCYLCVLTGVFIIVFSRG